MSYPMEVASKSRIRCVNLKLVSHNCIRFLGNPDKTTLHLDVFSDENKDPKTGAFSGYFGAIFVMKILDLKTAKVYDIPIR